MAKIHYHDDKRTELLSGRTIAIIGYGSQGHAHALNLRDAGFDVIIGLPEGSQSRAKAKQEGLRILDPAGAAKAAEIIMILAPDTKQPKLYEEAIEPGLEAGNMLMFAHGFNIHYGQIKPREDIDITMVAPKSPGHRLRELYTEGRGVPGLLAIHQDATGNATERALAYAQGIGCARAGIIETTFAEETETDLFGEQAVICGGVSALIQAGFETLTDAGYQPEIAYFECLHEMKLIVDLMYEGGLSYMRYSVSDTAEYGDYSSGPRIIDQRARDEMKAILQEIQDGRFARDWVLENMARRPTMEASRRKQACHPIEDTGRKLREMMPWIDGGAK